MRPPEGSGWGERSGGFSARRRRVGMIPGAFERHWTVSKRIPREKQRSERLVEVKTRKLRAGGCREAGSERWSAERCEVKGRR